MQSVTGLVLAGGRGSRMNGVDKGLQLLRGIPLVQHAMERLAPQVGVIAINANRNLERYAEFGAAVWPDAAADFAGPLAGFLAGLSHCTTEWLVTVPCDTPGFPLDLVPRLQGSLAGARAAIAVTLEEGVMQRQPVFCLLHKALREDLTSYLASGGRKIDRWLDQVGCVDVHFEDASAFFNANTTDELRQLGSA
jgi:molybdenum cofactor guanylyltransferase